MQPGKEKKQKASTRIGREGTKENKGMKVEEKRKLQRQNLEAHDEIAPLTSEDFLDVREAGSNQSQTFEG